MDGMENDVDRIDQEEEMDNIESIEDDIVELGEDPTPKDKININSLSLFGTSAPIPIFTPREFINYDQTEDSNGFIAPHILSARTFQDSHVAQVCIKLE